jgi:signal recognition particle receptor subunit beta
MPAIDHGQKLASFKIAWFGPPGCGRSTNLRMLHQRLVDYHPRPLEERELDPQRTISFEVTLDNFPGIPDWKICLRLHALTGPSHYEVASQFSLRHTDAAVFVADSSPDRLDTNLVALHALQSCLKAERREIPPLPAVFQYNKRDLPGAVLPSHLDHLLSAVTPHAVVHAVAKDGSNTLATLDSATVLARAMPLIQQE